MRRQPGAFQSILEEAGIYRKDAARLEAVLDLVDDFGRWGDLVADALLRWRQKARDEGRRDGIQEASDFWSPEFQRSLMADAVDEEEGQ